MKDFFTLRRELSEKFVTDLRSQALILSGLTFPVYKNPTSSELKDIMKSNRTNMMQVSQKPSRYLRGLILPDGTHWLFSMLILHDLARSSIGQADGLARLAMKFYAWMDESGSRILKLMPGEDDVELRAALAKAFPSIPVMKDIMECAKAELREGIFQQMPSKSVYTSFGHEDGEKVVFWVWHGGKVHTANGVGEELHSDHFPLDWFSNSMVPCGRVVPAKSIGTMSALPQNPREFERFKAELIKAFPRVKKFFISTLTNAAELMMAESFVTMMKPSYNRDKDPFPIYKNPTSSEIGNVRIKPDWDGGGKESVLRGLLADDGNAWLFSRDLLHDEARRAIKAKGDILSNATNILAYLDRTANKVIGVAAANTYISVKDEKWRATIAKAFPGAEAYHH